MVQNLMSKAAANNILVKRSGKGNFLRGDKFLNDCLYLHLEERNEYFLWQLRDGHEEKEAIIN